MHTLSDKGRLEVEQMVVKAIATITQAVEKSVASSKQSAARKKSPLPAMAVAIVEQQTLKAVGTQLQDATKHASATLQRRDTSAVVKDQLAAKQAAAGSRKPRKKAARKKPAQAK